MPAMILNRPVRDVELKPETTDGELAYAWPGIDDTQDTKGKGSRMDWFFSRHQALPNSCQVHHNCGMEKIAE